jgi:DNA-binding MarR family transcriptional regulator
MLNEIHTQGRTTSSYLSKSLNLSVPNTSRSVNSLYKLGYINKKKDINDKRITYISLSQKGLDLISKFIGIAQEKFLERFKVLSESEIDDLNDSFLKMKNILIKIRDSNNKNL